jgi:hypothetical protein
VQGGPAIYSNMGDSDTGSARTTGSLDMPALRS